MNKIKIFIFIVLSLVASQTQGRFFAASKSNEKEKAFSFEFIQEFFSLSEDVSTYDQRLRQIKRHRRKMSHFFKTLISYLEKAPSDKRSCSFILIYADNKYYKDDDTPGKRFSIHLEAKDFPNTLLFLKKIYEIFILILDHLKTVDSKTLPKDEDERLEAVSNIAQEIGEKIKPIFDEETMQLFDQLMAKRRILDQKTA